MELLRASDRYLWRRFRYLLAMVPLLVALAMVTTAWADEDSGTGPKGNPSQSLYLPSIFGSVAQPAQNGLRCNATGGSGGIATPGNHDVTIAGRPAMIIVGEGYSPARPTFLGYYLHGDGGQHKFHAQEFNSVNQLIRQQGWIYVAPQAPAVQPDYHPWHGPNGAPSVEADANLKQITDVLDFMFANYNVCRDVLFGASTSGGSWFYDYYVYPNQGANYPAFFNLNCGSSGLNANSGSLYTKVQQHSQNPSIKARTEFKYTIGTTDFLYANAERTIKALQDLGFSVPTDIMPNVAHCAYSTSQKIAEYWQQKSASLNLPDK